MGGMSKKLFVAEDTIDKLKETEVSLAEEGLSVDEKLLSVIMCLPNWG